MELWFAQIERDLLARGIFPSVADLRTKRLQYIRLHNKTCRLIQWAYSNPKHRIPSCRPESPCLTGVAVVSLALLSSMRRMASVLPATQCIGLETIGNG